MRQRKVLVVVANSSKARFFTNEDNLHLSELDGMACVTSCMKNQELTTDREGSFRGRGKLSPHATERPHTPKQNASVQFASNLANHIEELIHDEHYERLYLVAGSPFLGRLRQHLGNQANHLEGEQIGKDLTTRPSKDIREQLPYTL